jgi:hypothetical protein
VQVALRQQHRGRTDLRGERVDRILAQVGPARLVGPFPQVRRGGEIPLRQPYRGEVGHDVHRERVGRTVDAHGLVHGSFVEDTRGGEIPAIGPVRGSHVDVVHLAGLPLVRPVASPLPPREPNHGRAQDRRDQPHPRAQSLRQTTEDAQQGQRAVQHDEREKDALHRRVVLGHEHIVAKRVHGSITVLTPLTMQFAVRRVSEVRHGRPRRS